MRERLAADVQVAADGGPVAVGDPLPEAIRVEARRMTPQHPVVLGDRGACGLRAGARVYLGEDALRVGNGLQDMTADRQIELRVDQRELHGVVALELDALAEAARTGAGAHQVRLLEIDSDEASLRELAPPAGP